MASLTDKQKQRADGILNHLGDLLEKRIQQAGRVNPKVPQVSADILWHQIATMRQVIETAKGFGPIKLVVSDILCSTDEPKKRDLFNPSNQVCLLNEILPSEEESGSETRRAGQLEIRDVRTLYRALDPSLDKILTLIQTWIWWDLRDAADQLRFDMQEQRILSLHGRELDAGMVEYYRKEMGTRPGEDVTKQAVIRFELGRAREIVDRYQAARETDRGHQAIVVIQERGGSQEEDQMVIRLAKRLSAIEKVRSLNGNLDQAVKNYYSGQLGLSADRINQEAILRYEESQARLERQRLADLLLQAGGRLGSTANYKLLILGQMGKRLEVLAGKTGIAVPPPEKKVPSRTAEQAV